MRVTIKKRIGIAFVLLVAIIVAVGIYSNTTLKMVNDQSTIIAGTWIPKIQYSEEVNTMTSDFRILEYEHIISISKEVMDRKEAEMTEKNKKIQECLNEYEKSIYNEEDKELFNTVKTEWQKYLELNKNMLTLSRQLKTTEAMQIMNDQSKQAFDTASEAALKLVKFNEEKAKKSSEDGDRTYAYAKNILLIAILISSILAVVAGLFIAKSILKPISVLEKELETLAERGGDLTQQIKISSNDEIGKLSDVVNKFLANLRTIMIEVNNNTNNTANTVGIIKNSITELNEQVEDVRYTTEQMSSSMEEIAASTEEVNVTAEEITEAVNSITKKAQKGARYLEEISRRANELKTNSLASKKEADEIYENTKIKLEKAIEESKGVEQINALSDAILQISSQTNLLALNAAIEAARAGDAGKGFTVVAGEIRKLAEESNETVAEIQKVTNTVIYSVENLSNGSEEVLKFIDTKVKKDYNELVNTGEQYNKDANSISILMNDFSSTAEKLAASVENTMKAINEITEATTEGVNNTANIAEKAVVVSEKSDGIVKAMDASKENIDKLLQIVSKFKI